MKNIKEKNIKWWMKTISYVLLFFIISIFAYTKICFISKGVKIDASLSSTDTNKEIFIVEGMAKKATKLYLNGREIFINKNGYFREIIAPPTGYSVITLNAKDKFGNESSKKFQLIKESVNSKLVISE